jgi:hypothetical protein
MMNKKGQVESIFMLGLVILVFIVLAGLVALGSGILTFTSSTINEVTSGLGVQGYTNLSHVSDATIGTANNTIQMLKWGSGVILFFAIVGIMMFAVTIRLNPNGFTIGLYLLMALIFVFTSIFMSNIYGEFLAGTDEIALELRSMVLSNFILNFLPHIMTVITFIGGMIIFSGLNEETN